MDAIENFTPQDIIQGSLDTDGACEPANLSAVLSRQNVCTRPAVASFMLDLAGYVATRPLHRLRFVDPAAGPGVIVLEAIDRLLAAWRADPHAALDDLEAAIRAIEIDAAVVARLRARVRARLGAAGLAPSDIDRLAEAWCVTGDFLDAGAEPPVDVIVANPPFRRYDHLTTVERTRLRRDFVTFRRRCDLYVPFIEQALSRLKDQGTLAVVTPDRWQRTGYGAELRRLIADQYHLRIQVDASEQPVFSKDVDAYPAISVITRRPPGATRLARISAVTPAALDTLAKALCEPAPGVADSPTVHSVPGYARREGPWWRGTPEHIGLIDRLSQTFPPLKAIGCNVSNGLATGANHVYVAKLEPGSEAATVEDRFWVPTVLPGDVSSGSVVWSGHYLLHLWTDDDKLVDPVGYPGLDAYLQSKRADLSSRYVARSDPTTWFRTIDRPRPGLLRTPKLLIADILQVPRFALDAEGRFYPRNGVYVLVSSEWPLPALRLILESGLARLFLSATSPTVRAGSVRCQAQYLRDIPLQPWHQVPAKLKRALTEAAGSRAPRPDLLAQLFDLSPGEEQLITTGTEPSRG